MSNLKKISSEGVDTTNGILPQVENPSVTKPDQAKSISSAQSPTQKAKKLTVRPKANSQSAVHQEKFNPNLHTERFSFDFNNKKVHVADSEREENELKRTLRKVERNFNTFKKDMVRHKEVTEDRLKEMESKLTENRDLKLEEHIRKSNEQSLEFNKSLEILKDDFHKRDREMKAVSQKLKDEDKEYKTFSDLHNQLGDQIETLRIQQDKHNDEVLRLFRKQERSFQETQEQTLQMFRVIMNKPSTVENQSNQNVTKK